MERLFLIDFKNKITFACTYNLVLGTCAGRSDFSDVDHQDTTGITSVKLLHMLT